MRVRAVAVTMSALVCLGAALGLLLPRAPVDGPVTVDVHVVAAGTKPVVGASTFIVSRVRRSEAVYSDAAGVARVPWSSREGETAWVVVTAPYFVRGLAAVGTRDGKVVVVLVQGVLVSGVVRDAATGAAVPGARVSAYEDEHGEVDCLMPRLPPLGEAQSGSDGAFQVGPVPRDRPLRLRCEAAGRVPRVLVIQSPGGALADLALPPGVALRGVVRDSAGRPVDGAEVTANIVDDGEESGFDSPRSTTTDRTGGFEIDGLARGRTYGIDASRDGVGEAPFDPPLTVDEAAPAFLSMDLVLLHPVTITVRVVGPDGAAVGDAHVRVDAPGISARGTTKADHGSVSFEVPPGALTIKVSSTRFAERTVESEAVEGKPLAVEVALKTDPR